MAAKAQTNTRQQGLQQAAAILFTLMAVVPLLVFAFTLWHEHHVESRPRAAAPPEMLVER